MRIPRFIACACVVAALCCAGCKRESPPPVTSKRTSQDRPPPKVELPFADATGPYEMTVVEERFPSGELRCRTEVKKYADGRTVEHGVKSYWFQNGQKEAEGHFVDGVRNGSWISWYEDGTLEETGTFKDDKKNDTWMAWHRHGGKAVEEGWKEGIPHGRSLRWDYGGNLTQDSQFVDGQLVSPATQPASAPATEAPPTDGPP